VRFDNLLDYYIQKIDTKIKRADKILAKYPDPKSEKKLNTIKSKFSKLKKHFTFGNAMKLIQSITALLAALLAFSMAYNSLKSQSVVFDKTTQPIDKKINKAFGINEQDLLKHKTKNWVPTRDDTGNVIFVDPRSNFQV
jgi:hypothetical protein